MKRAYIATIDEFTETTLRVLELQGLFRRQRWRSIWIIPFTVAVILWLGRSGPWRVNAVFGGIAGVLSYIVYVLFVTKLMRQRLRSWVVKTLGSENPIPCEYELTEDQLIFRMPGEEKQVSWKNVVAVRKTPAAIEIQMQRMELYMLRSRIFDGPEEMDAWYRFIQKQVGDDRQPSPVGVPPTAVER